MVLGKLYAPLAVDLWSSGVILFAMLTGYLPFEDDNNSVLYKKIVNLDYKVPAFVDIPGKFLLTKLITTQERRLSLEAVKLTDFFNVRPFRNNQGIRVAQTRAPTDLQACLEIAQLYGLPEALVRGSV
jgi:5'-AMP-activated protein kinase catalytic alpha subunit